MRFFVAYRKDFYIDCVTITDHKERRPLRTNFRKWQPDKTAHLRPPKTPVKRGYHRYPQAKNRQNQEKGQENQPVLL